MAEGLIGTGALAGWSVSLRVIEGVGETVDGTVLKARHTACGQAFTAVGAVEKMTGPELDVNLIALVGRHNHECSPELWPWRPV